jgi:hypothetical protein
MTRGANTFGVAVTYFRVTDVTFVLPLKGYTIAWVWRYLPGISGNAYILEFVIYFPGIHCVDGQNNGQGAAHHMVDVAGRFL